MGKCISSFQINGERQYALKGILMFTLTLPIINKNEENTYQDETKEIMNNLIKRRNEEIPKAIQRI